MKSLRLCCKRQVKAIVYNNYCVRPVALQQFNLNICCAFKRILGTSIPKLKNLEDSGKINSSVKLIIELYKTYGIRSLYRGGTLLMIRFGDN